MVDKPSAPNGDGTQQGKGPSLWSAAIAAILMGTLVAMIAIVSNAYPEESDAASILGIVIPAVVSLGAASFGVAVAYNAAGGKAEAEAGKVTAQVGQKNAEQSKQQTVATARDKADQAMAHIDNLEQAVKRIVEPVEKASTSPHGVKDLLLASSEPGQSPIRVHTEDIGSVTASIAAARSNLAGLKEGIDD